MKETTIKEKTLESGTYIEGIGRRKKATARVRISVEPSGKISSRGEDKSPKKSFLVNEKSLNEYFPTEEMRGISTDALNKVKGYSKFTVSAHVRGGGIHAQAEALRHGLARAIVTFDEEIRKRFKKAGFLKRDPRMKERKKFGRKKARKSGQWSKR